ncbi:restriction endonuclease subunit S [Mycoplasma wenyonii]|uniref:restriction endonuclease subunit S n=1 Tax=Mycoplasma wenyonii TaxID=65123 RepID=UPI00215EAA3A|nr:restriction endonuclease subunit S [Mycoplasma wenyonii]
MSKLGDYIERVKEVIPYDKNIPVKGLSVDKCFTETHITNLDRIKVPFQLVKRGQFCYKPSTARNGDKLSLAFNSELDKIQISTTYVVFQINNPQINHFYLDFFFKKTLTDKIVRYSATGGVREELSWKNFGELPISIPPLNKQERIVKKYQTVTRYIELKRRINELFEKQMTAYFHILFDNLSDYTIKNFGELFTIIRGGRPPRGNLEQEKKYFCKERGIPWLQVRDISKKGFKFVDKTEESLTKEGFRRANCHVVSPKDLIFIHNASSSQLGKIYVNSSELTMNTNFWGISNNLARRGGIKIISP